MIDVLRFVLGSFWRFLGALILLAVVCDMVRYTMITAVALLRITVVKTSRFGGTSAPERLTVVSGPRSSIDPN